MSVIDTRMKGWVKLPSDTAYTTLKTTGTYTQDGRTITYDETTAYLTPDTGIGGTGLDGNKAVITNASGDIINSGVTSTELSYLTNARKNLQQQIDELASKIGTASAGVYVLHTLDELLASVDTPGTYYVPDAYGTYYQYIIDDAGKIQLVGTGIPPEDIGQQDLTAYQKKADPTLKVKYAYNDPYSGETKGAVVGTVVGSINELDKEIGDAFPLSTTAQTVTSAINELALRNAGEVEISGANRIQVTSTPLPSGKGNKYIIGHIDDTLTTAGTYGNRINEGQINLALPTVDSYGHVLSTTPVWPVYAPTSAGTNGQVWSWDAVNNKGAWATVSASGTYTADNGIKLDGTTIKHVNTGKTASYGSDTDALRIVADDQGHLTAVSRPVGTSGQYINNSWEWTSPKDSASSILDGSAPEKLVNASAINDIMGGMRIKKITQANYDALPEKDTQTIYVIVN